MGRPGAGRVRAAGLCLPAFRRLPVENVILSLEALPLGSATRLPATSHSESACVTGGRRPWPAAPGKALHYLRAGEPLQKGILQHDREFQLPRYLRIGQLMVSAEHFSIGEANTI